jgi:hypothetical protein
LKKNIGVPGLTTKTKKHCSLWYSWRNVKIIGSVLTVCGIYLFFVSPAVSSSSAPGSSQKPLDPAQAATAIGALLSAATATYTVATARKQQSLTNDLEQKKFSFEVQVKNWEQLEKMNRSLQERVAELEKEGVRLNVIIDYKQEKIQQLQIELLELKERFPCSRLASRGRDGKGE